MRLYQRLTFVNEKDPVAFIDFSGLSVDGYDNGFLRQFVLNQVRKYYKPYEIEIRSGKGTLTDRTTVFRNGLGSQVYGKNILFFNRVYVDQLDEDLGSIRNPSKFAMAIANTVTHEIGHSLGLDHNTVHLNFIMDSVPRTLDELFSLQTELSFSPDNQNYLYSRLNK